MKVNTKIVFLVLAFLLPTFCFSIDLWDTLYVCQGESIQLQTLANQESYTWSPDENINSTDIYNPVVSPTISTTYIVEVEATPTFNLIYNGDFSLGLVGVTSDYFYTSVNTVNQGYFSVMNDTHDFNTWFDDCQDHTDTDDGFMFIVDGATTPNLNAWCQEVGVESGETYTFSAWATSIYWQNPSLLEFRINGNLIGPTMQLSPPQCEWTEFTTDWYSGSNSTATICISNQNIEGSGNDFALDDISFGIEHHDFIDTFTVIVLDTAATLIEVTICANEHFYHDGFEIPADTQVIINYSTFNGCDSLIYVTVNSIDTSYIETRIDTLCPGDTVLYLGIPITSDTSICDIYTNYLGCDSSVCFVVSFFSETTLSILTDAPSCYGEEDGMLLANPLAGTPPYSYSWNTGITNTLISNLAAGQYFVTVIDATGCLVEKSIELTQPDSIVVDYLYTPPSCHGLMDGDLTINVSGGTADYLVLFDDQVASSDLFYYNISGGTYSLFVEDAQQCISEFTFELEQPDPITVFLPEEISLLLGDEVSIEAGIISNYPYELQWFPSIDLDCSSCFNPSTSTLQDVEYYLQVLDSEGCLVLDTISIDVINNFDLYIPNAFSPNGDGINDYFELYAGKGVREIISFSVFNRWGGLVFNNERYFPGDTAGRWDGNNPTQEGQTAVYVYVAQVRFWDNEIKTFSGDVLLIR